MYKGLRFRKQCDFFFWAIYFTSVNIFVCIPITRNITDQVRKARADTAISAEHNKTVGIHDMYMFLGLFSP